MNQINWFRFGAQAIRLALLSLTIVLAGHAVAYSENPFEEEASDRTCKMTPEAFMKGRSANPRFKGEFEVGYILVTFPDTETPDIKEIMAKQSEGVADYFKEYTQGVCRPTFRVLSPNAYVAPHPMGYYLEHASGVNEIGWQTKSDGLKRLRELHKNALRSVTVGGSSARGKPSPINVIIFPIQLKPLQYLAAISSLRKVYPEPEIRDDDERYDPLSHYHPLFCFPGHMTLPDWKGSTILFLQTHQPADLIHMLGHQLGDEDFDHTCEKTGGIVGTPVTHSGGPCGPAYCRWKYCGTLPKDAYRLITTETTITLAPRWSRYTQGAEKPLGVFIPTAHPNYILHLEYEPGNSKNFDSGINHSIGLPSSGDSSNGGINIYYLNITKCSPRFGHPDACYSYRTDDPTMRGHPRTIATFGEGDTFDQESNPKNVLPNELPTGIEFEFGKQTEEGATITIRPPRQQIKGPPLKQSLLPIIKLLEITDIQPTTICVDTDLTFYGEPWADERGVVYGPRPKPTYPRSPHVQIHNRQGFDKARVMGLTPGSTIYVRAYAKSKLGVTYSDKEEKIVLPKITPDADVAPLCIDKFDDYLDNRAYIRSEDGSRVDNTVMISFLKLMALHRTRLDGSKPKKKSKRKEKSYRIEANLDALHHSPTYLRYPPTMENLYLASEEAQQLGDDLGLHTKSIPDDLADRFVKVLKYPKRPRKGQEVVVNLESGEEQIHAARIYDSLINGWPVLCLRENDLVSSPRYALNMCIIDGVKTADDGTKLYHIIYPNGYDRMPKTGRRSGWHPLEVLTSDILQDGARLLFLHRKGKRF